MSLLPNPIRLVQKDHKGHQDRTLNRRTRRTIFNHSLPAPVNLLPVQPPFTIRLSSGRSPLCKSGFVLNLCAFAALREIFSVFGASVIFVYWPQPPAEC